MGVVAKEQRGTEGKAIFVKIILLTVLDQDNL